MGRQCHPSSSSNCCSSQHSERMPALWLLLLFILATNRPATVGAASASSSFGISAAVPLAAEALLSSPPPLGDGPALGGGWRNASEMMKPGGSKNSKSKMAPAGQSSELCDKLNLTPRQKQICVQGGDGLAETLLEAIRMSALTCQHQFEYERWNCTLQDYSRLLLLKKAYRETAVLYAFSAAGVAHAVARACAAGRLRKCHCAEADNEVETRQTWRWGGCGDNLAYAKAFARKFLDAGPKDGGGSGGGVGKAGKVTSKKKKKKANMQNEMEALSRALRKKWKRSMPNNAVTNGRRTQSDSATGAGGGIAGTKKQKSESQRQRINRHNNAVGIQVVEHLVNRTCKCHGVSGSCSVRTCWHQLAAFSETAAQIKAKYEGAVQVSAEIRENSVHLRPVPPGRAASSHHYQKELEELMMGNQPVTQNRAKKASEGSSSALSIASSADRSKSNKKELIFQQKSPDFCSAGPLGPGTGDRVCHRGENCDILCCGRGYNVHKTAVMIPCRCKLILCCRVECQNCLVEKIIRTCK